jgi:hypothetical protein
MATPYIQSCGLELHTRHFCLYVCSQAHPRGDQPQAPRGGKTRLVDKDGRRALFIRGIRERITATLRCGNADAIRAWTLGCFAAATIAAGA